MESTFKSSRNLERDLRPTVNREFLRLLKDLHLGSVDPQNVSRDVKLERKEFLSPKTLVTLSLAAGKSAQDLIEKVAPQNPPYLAVQEAMEKIYPTCISGEWRSITPVKQALRIYSRNPVIIEIKQRLKLLGYEISHMNDEFDADVLNAVVDIQWNMWIKPDGEISPNGKIWSFLAVPCMDRVRQLQADMEKMRWFPQYFESRYIFVNLAMSYFILYDGSTDWTRVQSFRTVNGRVARKSPTMRDEVVKVIINPFWIVPPTIFYEDKVRDLRDLNDAQIAEYFKSHNYEVWDSNFNRKLDPTSIDWKSISAGREAPDILIRQRPHLGNALGVLKFDLTNPFSIYLHDTNQRELFNEPMRQLSSGCIRLEKPLDLAEYLLEDTPWDRKTIEANMAHPGEVLNKSIELPVPKNKRTSVYTVYLTSQISSDGVVRFVTDTYGQNASIRRQLMGSF
jgi:murein L,D-transpeptidase YcbB/YkuD